MGRKPEFYGPTSALTEEEVDILWQEYVGDRTQEVRDQLIEYYMPLVYKAAERMAGKLPSHVDVDDLIGAGTFGLLDAVDLFDPTRDVKFSTYCSSRITGAILDELRRLDWAPRLVRSRAREIERHREALESDLGRRASEDELARSMGLSAEEFEERLRDANVKNMVSLDRKFDEDDDHEIGQLETLADTRAENPLTELERKDLKEVAIRGLRENEKAVLVMYYYEEMNLKEIGAVLGLSESRVCQIHAQTIEFLRKKFRDRHAAPV
jgi:RNA polymerase sigma factor for flagellar operon FliA